MARVALICIASVLLVACGGIKDQQKNFVMTAEEKTAFASQVPDQAVRKLESDLRRARSQGFDRYAPQHLAKAEEHAASARELLQRRAPRADITQQIVLGNRYLSNGQVVRKNVLTELRDVFAERDYLMSIGVHALYPGEFEDAVEDLAEIIAKLEQGDKHGAITQRSELMTEMTELEVRGTVEKNLGAIQRTFEALKDDGYDELAGRASQAAFDVLQESEAYISTNTRDTKGVAKAKARALFEVNHFKHVAEAVRELRKIGPQDLETIITAQEARLAKVGEALGLADLRDRALDDQVSALVEVAKNPNRPRRSWR